MWWLWGEGLSGARGFGRKLCVTRPILLAAHRPCPMLQILVPRVFSALPPGVFVSQGSQCKNNTPNLL
jgi:hypothetical protein